MLGEAKGIGEGGWRRGSGEEPRGTGMSRYGDEPSRQWREEGTSPERG